ncbi:MAG: TatD family hydrolase, partial [Actinomycetota bacterium]|nr:TatD family hydrolase [Actinomycetota bacterium]
MIDTHAHLDACADPPGEVLARARAVGVARVITVGSGIASCRKALAICEREEGVFAALGIHPHQAGEAGDGDLAELRD